MPTPNMLVDVELDVISYLTTTVLKFPYYERYKDYKRVNDSDDSISVIVS